MAKKFVHLHLHTEYSLLDGLSKISKLFMHLRANDMDACAISDHGAMYGAIEFYKKAQKEKIKPIIGIEAYTTNVDLKIRPERGKFKNFHLLLLAKNKTGYRNLMKLTSIAHLKGYYYRPRVDRETLAKYAAGLICTSACAQGEIAQSLIANNYQEAKKTAQWFSDIFGEDYYLEVQRHEYDKYIDDLDNDELKSELREQSASEKTINKGVLKLSRELGIPIVATNDAHYIKKEDAQAQDALVCIATGKNISDVKRLRYIDSPTFYVKSPKEMEVLFRDMPEAIANTEKIADKCSLTITLNKWYFPEYELESKRTPISELEEKVEEGISERIPRVTEEIKKRLKYEMKIIKDKGYATYFLIVSDMAQWAQEQGIVTNTRGSTAGSLVAYALGIVSINPIKYDLPFERFLTPWRPSPPDIDFDIADNRREEVISYITDKYGHEKVAQICTFGRMQARASVRDTARVLGYPYAVGDRIAKVMPIGSQGFPMSIGKALTISPDLKNMYDTDADAKRVIDLAQQVEGNSRHISVHAAGLVIAPRELTEFTPIQLDPEGKKTITQYDMDALDPNVSPGEAVGLLKFDLLGLRNLSILGSAIEIVNQSKREKIELHNIPLDDEKTYEMLSRGDTMGVFQLSGSGMTRYLKDLKPTRIEDLMAMVALYRPGPMAQIPEYIERKNNPGKVTYFDPRMKEYLGKSYGLLVYQDDVFLTAIDIAGYTWEEADKFRKAVGKKIPKEMEKQKEKFIKGAVKNGMDKEKAEELFKLIEPFSGYGFNKAHAASYGLVAYQTAYMKANYTVEFMGALLTAESNDAEKISAAVNECKRMGINVLPPDINESEIGFKIVKDKKSLKGKAIRFGLSAIKNVGAAAIEAILGARADGEFMSFADFISRADTRRVNKKVLESLIKVGALIAFGTRASLLSSLDEVRVKVSKPKGHENQQGLFTREEITNTKKTSAKAKDTVDEFSDEELQNLERQLLGFSISARPIGDQVKSFIHSTTHKIFEISPKESLDELVRIAAIVSEVRIVVTRRTGQEMAFVRVEDETGSLDLIVFPKIFQRTRDVWVDNRPLLISGRVDTREESPSIIVEAIETKQSFKDKLSSAQSGKEHLFIRIPENIDANKLRKLKDLLIENPGIKKVSLKFEGKKGQVDLNIGVSWSEEIARQIADVLET